jgi:peptidoglycan/xylan/chitin deacetylase (PgdA/CDA1 family)
VNARGLVLDTAKAIGGFWLADRMRRPGIAILCYHGFAAHDEHRFRPALFIRPAAFEARLKWLQESGYNVIPLAEAIERLETGVFGKRDAVITIDDGFHSVAAIGWPLLKKFGMPATLYATTYYSTHANPVFRLAVQYFFWRAPHSGARFDDLCPTASDPGAGAMWPLIHWGETRLDENERWTLACRVAERLDVDHAQLRRSRRLSLLTPEELRALSQDGLDVQLHTHRHNLPEDAEGVEREIADNRKVLSAVSDRHAVHFCYPSGVWSRRHWAPLERLGVRSATTCLPGFNVRDTPRLALRRFLDSDRCSQRDFEAELTGFKSLMRGMRGQ